MITMLTGDCRNLLRQMPDESVHCVVTSPPYWGLRDYGVAGQIGLETSPDQFVIELGAVFREVRRVLRSDGTLWLNLGDSYAGGGRGGGSEESKQRTNAGSLIRPPKWSEAFRPGNPDKNQGKSNRDGLGSVVGLKPKDLCGIPWRVAFALQADGWWLRQDIIWSKPNPMPESVTDRCTKAHEYLFLLSKAPRYYYDQDAIRDEPTGRTDPIVSFGKGKPPCTQDHTPNYQLDGLIGRNKRSVWEVTTQPFSEAHFAIFPPALIEPCIKAGCPIGGTVLDPFAGAGTTGLVADRLQRNAILIELNPTYADMTERRLMDDAPLFVEWSYGRQR